MDDEDDVDAVQLLIDPNPPQGFLVSATERIIFGSLPYVPKKNIQLFAQVYRYRIPINTPPSGFNKLFFRIVQVICCVFYIYHLIYLISIKINHIPYKCYC